MHKYLIFFIAHFINAYDNYNIPSNPEIKEMLYKEYKVLDKKLNLIYKKILLEVPKKEKENLIKSQKYWVQYRNMECYTQSYPMRDGTGEGIIEVNCLISITEIRIKTLKNGYVY